MQLETSPEQQFLLETTGKFLAAEASPQKLRDLYQDPVGFDKEYWRRGAELGWTSMLVPEDWGGGTVSGRRVPDLLMFAEAFGRSAAPGPLTACNVVAYAVSQAGSTAQREAILPGLTSGATLATWCFAGAAGRWSPNSVSITASDTSDGYRLDGIAYYVEAASQADWLLVTARTSQGLTQLLVPGSTPGLTIQPMTSVDIARRFGEVRFTGTVVPVSAVLGDQDNAIELVEHQVELAAILQCAEANGSAGRVFEFTLEYMFERYSFGRQLASYQALKHRFADMKLWLECCYATADAAAEAFERRDANAPELASVAKSYVGDHTVPLIQECVQMHGGMGVTWEHDIHLYLRRALVNRALFGTPEQHREAIAGWLIQTAESR